MTATKVYVLGGLSLVLVILCHVWYGGWPWEEPKAAGLASLWAAMIADPIAVALGTLAVLLGLLQVYVTLRNGLKVIMAVAYVAGAATFWYALHRTIEQEYGWWDTVLSPVMLIGLVLLLTVIVVNLVGVVRFSPKGKA